MSGESFQQVISEHLALAERNRRLEPTMPLDAYRKASPGELVRAGSTDHEEPSTELNVAAPRRKESSWWDASEERPLPEFAWGAD